MKHSPRDSKVAAVAVGLMATVSLAEATTSNFSLFVAPTVSSPRKRPAKHWNVVTPISATNGKKRRKSKAGSINDGVHATSTPRTASFGALTAAGISGKTVDVHTLILGTHPSIKSLEKQEYYAHPMNAFWWIAGDCLGFRRGSGVSTSSGKPFKMTSSLRHDNVIPYEQQLEILTGKGFAVWDIVKECERPGSLDSAISEDEPNAIREFCQQYPSIQRIVLANGTSGCKFFIKHFRDWLDSGELVPCEHSASQKTFSKWAKARKKDDQLLSYMTEKAPLQLVSALAVSPAAAKYSYEQKRDFWDEHVYRPGLADFEISKKL